MNKIKAVFSCILICFLLNAEAQKESPYRFNVEAHISIFSLSAFNYLITPHTEALTVTQVVNFDKNKINGFDRFATSNYAPLLARQSDIILYSSFVFGGLTPILFPILSNKGNNLISESGKIIGMYLSSFMLCYTGTNMVKANVLRTRPYVYNPFANDYNKFDTDARYSFFSGHASHTALNSFYAAKLFNDYFPDSKLRYVVWTAAAVIPAYTAYLRVAAGKHFPTDVLAGYVYGAFCGFIVPYVFKIKK